jgi:hypothetical protein
MGRKHYQSDSEDEEPKKSYRRKKDYPYEGRRKHHSKHQEDILTENLSEEDTSESMEEINMNEKDQYKLKKKLNHWLDYDDEIKRLNDKIKKMKEEKKELEKFIMNDISKYHMDTHKIDVHDFQDNFRGRVYKYKSVTRGAIKPDTIKEALMEIIQNERKVNQLTKKIENRRPVNERYYLKRTKGNKDD